MEDWGDNLDHLQDSSPDADQGRSYGKGRGFVPHDSSSDFGNGRGGRGGGRNGRVGGQRNWQDNTDKEDFGHDNKDDKNGGFKPLQDADNGGFRPNRDRDDEDGGDGFKPRGGRGSGGGRGGRGGGYRSRDGDEDGGDGGGGGYRDRYNDYDNGNDYNEKGGGRGGRGGRGGSRGSRGGGRRGDGNGDGDGGFGRSRDVDDEGNEKPRENYIPPDLDTDEKSLFDNFAAGINFGKYDKIDVKVSGEGAPEPIMSFDSAGLRDLVMKNIIKSGYTKPTPVQKYALPIIMSGRDLMACAQTGSGKTAAFAVPIINMLLKKNEDLITRGSCAEPQCIIVSPTRELTIQIYQQISKFALTSILKTVIAYGGTSCMHQGNRVSAGCHILVATPGRLLDFLDRGRISFNSIRFLVLDEADRMLDMGFLPSIERIVDHETMVPQDQRQTLMFSATFPEAIQRLAARFLNKYLFLAVGIVGGACSDVEQVFHEVSGNRKKQVLKEILEKEQDAGTLEGTLIFVEQKKKADFIAVFLSESSYPTTSIHGDRLQSQREEALRDFKSGRMSILVATAVAARGLDIKNVKHVINFDLPKQIDEYVHRIGRTGRVGNRGRATSFYDPEANGELREDLIRILKQTEQPVPDWLVGDAGSSFAPGRGDRFGGEDYRDFHDGEAYGEGAYNTGNTMESEEVW